MSVLRIMKRWLCTLIAAIACILPSAFLTAQGEDAEEYLYNGNIYYKINESDEIVITRSRASVTEAVIPGEINGMTVTEIAGSAFLDRTRLTSVSLPDTIKAIGDYAFRGCTRLETIAIPSGVSKIGWNILEDTPWLANQPKGCIIVGDNVLVDYTGDGGHVEIPQGVTAIAGCAFEDGATITSITIPTTVKSIGGLAFSGCAQISEIVIPEGVENIGAYAFNWCVALQKAEIANTVTSIGNHAFVGCVSLISVKLPVKLTRIDSAMFYGCKSLTKIQIPNTVKEIGAKSFYGCISLGDVTLRSTVLSVGEDAFGDCVGMKTLTFYNVGCNIASTENTVYSSVVICGFKESTAQIYAQSYGRKFTEAKPLLGDVDEDGSVTLKDGQLVLSLYAGTASGITEGATHYQLIAGDINGNESLDIADAAAILKLYAEKSAGL